MLHFPVLCHAVTGGVYMLGMKGTNDAFLFQF